MRSATIDHKGDRGFRRRLASLLGIVMLLAALGALGGTSAYAEEAHELVRTIHGTELPEQTFDFMLGVAVDNSNDASQGDLYVYERNSTSFEGVIHKFDGEGKYLGVQITGADTPQGSIVPLAALYGGRFSGIAVDSSSSSPNSGDIYVSDIGHGVVDKFSESGAFVCQITAKPPASRTTAEAEHECDGATGSEVPGTTSIEPTGIAVNADGDVYVADYSHRVIDEFGPSGKYLGQISNSHIVQPGALSIAPDGDIYMLNYEQNIVKFNSEGAFLSTFDEEEPAEEEHETPEAMTVDPTNGHVYTKDRYGETIREFGEKDELLGTVSSEEPGYALGLAVSNVTGDLFAAERVLSGGAIYQYSGDLVPGAPKITSESSWNTTATSSELRTTIEPSKLATTCHVEYVDEEQFKVSGYAGVTPVGCSPDSFPASFATTTATVQLNDLHDETTYHYRFVVANSAAPNGVIGPEETFTTFGVQSFSIDALGPLGEVDALAGSHPYELTTTITFPTTNVPGQSHAVEANPRNVEVQLPPGLIGNPRAVDKCSPYDVAHADCSGASQVGIVTLETPSEHGAGHNLESPIYNLVPPKGVAAQFGARFNGYVTAHIDAKVRTGEGYGVEADSLYVSSAEGLASATVTLWGVPSADSHDPERYCPVPGEDNEEKEHTAEGQELYRGYPCTERGPAIPFLSNPTSCTSSHATSARVDSWQEPEAFVGASGEMPAITGCGKLGFNPAMSIKPTSKASDSPSGLDVELKVPQNEDPTGLATADLKDAKVTLPEGVTVNPSSANGLVGCPLLSGKGAHAGESGIDLENGEAANCPEASKVGSVKIKTPLLEEELEGGVYVAEQNANPFGSLLALYIAVEDRERGVVVKLAGRVEANAQTGQLTTTFDENPQLPFDTLSLDFFGGERAPLATPRACGSYQPTALLEPFSHQGAPGEAGTPDAEPYIEPFLLTSGPGGSACGASSFAPTFEAGTESPQAGAFSPFTMTLRRDDGEQRFSTVSLTMPPGVAGVISSVTPCANAQAEAGDCPSASKIGHVTVLAGVGGEPLTIPQAGNGEDPVYLTETYGGAPFGLSIVVPAQAGPFNLGTVVVRAKIEVNPHNGQVTVVSNPMPSILQGIPVDVRTINVTVDKPGFTFNPTNCAPLSVTGAIGSQEGATANLSTHFQATNCANLKFEPQFTVTTSGKTSKADGASLTTRIAEPANALGADANIAKVKVELPKALPSRLTTLQKACTAAQFEANPAGCPAASVVGHARAITPILPVPLEGPAYFVSHGGEAFPNLTMVLQGDNVTVVLVGDTFISKAGITSSTFKEVPDVPVSSFELTLPEAANSALAANGNLCAQLLTMPTEMIGQNGATLTQTTKIAVEGCAPALYLTAHTVKHGTVTLQVNVPTAGTLTATGHGLTHARKQPTKAKLVTLRLRLTSSEQRFLAHHPGRRLKSTVHLTFTPTHRTNTTTGKLTGKVTVLVR